MDDLNAMIAEDLDNANEATNDASDNEVLPDVTEIDQDATTLVEIEADFETELQKFVPSESPRKISPIARRKMGLISSSSTVATTFFHPLKTLKKNQWHRKIPQNGNPCASYLPFERCPGRLRTMCSKRIRSSCPREGRIHCP